MRKNANLLAILLCTALLVCPSEADIVITGDVAAGTGELEITENISFNIIDNSTVRYVVFDNWTTNDGGLNEGQLEAGASVLAFNLNGSSAMQSASLGDNFIAGFNDLSTDDGYLFLSGGPTLSVGDTFTLLAGTYSIQAIVNFNPALNNSTFSGDVFLTNGLGTRISENGVSVLLGDANDDGSFGNLDIGAFVLALTNPPAYQAMYPDVDPDVVLDMNGDGGFDNADIAGFVAALTGP